MGEGHQRNCWKIQAIGTAVTILNSPPKIFADVLALLGRFLRLGIPESVLRDLWMVGVWRGWLWLEDIGLEAGAWALSRSVFGSVRSQSAATNVSTLRVRIDRSWRSQEHSADGNAACAWQLRSIASLYQYRVAIRLRSFSLLEAFSIRQRSL